MYRYMAVWACRCLESEAISSMLWRAMLNHVEGDDNHKWRIVVYSNARPAARRGENIIDLL